MNTALKLSLMAGSALVSLSIPRLAMAAEAAADTRVEEVIVTAEKREQNLKDVPQSVTALSGANLDLLRASTLEDYLTRVPGAILVGDQPGSSRIVLRGINAGGVSATIGTYVDETPYGSVTGLANGGVLAPDIETFDMQRIEVLRGPQGTLYGASSLGGLLKYVTNAPDPRGYAARVEVDGEDTSHGELGGSVKAMVNVPLGDKLAVRLSGFYDDLSGFIDDPLRNATRVNETKYSGGRFSVLAKPSDNLTIRLSAVLEDISSRGTSDVDVNPATLQPLYGDLTQSRTFSQPNRVAYRIADLNVGYDFGFAKLTSISSYATLRQDANGDATAMYGALLTQALDQPLGAGVVQDLKQKKFTQELRLASGPQKFEWLVGGFYTNEQNTLRQSLNGVSLIDPPAIVPGFGGLETVYLPTRYYEYAGFLNADYHFTDRFDLSAGGRYSHNNQRFLQTTDGPLVGGASTITGDSSEGVFTFAVAPKYKISDDVTAYARISKGYRPGGPNLVNPLAPAAVPKTFASDSLIDYEAGVKTDFLDHRITLDVTGFYIDWSRIQLLADVGGFGVNINGGSAESKGVEASLDYSPMRGISLSANGAFTQANLTENTPALVGGVKGDRLPYSPRISGAFSADYEFPVATGTDVFLGGSLRVTGQRYGDFSTMPSTDNHLSLPAYASLDLRAGFDLRKVRIEAYVKNVNDARGILNIGGFSSTPNGAVQEGVTRPRTYGVSLSAAY